MRRVLAVGVEHVGKHSGDVEIDVLGLCQPSVDMGRAAHPLYEYDVIILNPQSYTHFLFGRAGPHSGAHDELSLLKRDRNSYDIDSAFNHPERSRELEVALEEGAKVIWCLADPKQVNFFGRRETHLGYASADIASLVRRADLQVKKGRRIGRIDADGPFAGYFAEVARSGWTLCLAEPEVDGLTSIAETPSGHGLGGRVDVRRTVGWLVTPPTSPAAQERLVRDALALGGAAPMKEAYHGLFLSHTGDDKPFVRRLRDDLLARGVPRVWLDEAEIEIGDSLTGKIEEGLAASRYVAVVLSRKSVAAPWVRKELETAMTREVLGGDVVVLPLLYERCELPGFLSGKFYADFTDPSRYEAMLEKLLRRLRVR